MIIHGFDAHGIVSFFFFDVAEWNAYFWLKLKCPVVKLWTWVFLKDPQKVSFSILFQLTIVCKRPKIKDW